MKVNNMIIIMLLIALLMITIVAIIQYNIIAKHEIMLKNRDRTILDLETMSYIDVSIKKQDEDYLIYRRYMDNYNLQAQRLTQCSKDYEKIDGLATYIINSMYDAPDEVFFRESICHMFDFHGTNRGRRIAIIRRISEVNYLLNDKYDYLDHLRGVPHTEKIDREIREKLKLEIEYQELKQQLVELNKLIQDEDNLIKPKETNRTGG